MIVLKQLLIWLILSISYFIATKYLLRLLFPGFHDVGLWLMMIIGDLLFILIIMIFALVIKSDRYKQDELYWLTKTCSNYRISVELKFPDGH